MAKAQTKNYHMVVVTQGEVPRVASFTNHDILIESGLKPLVGTECHVFVFEGERLSITGKPHYLVLPDDRTFPLFDLPEPDTSAVLADGYLGEPEEDIESSDEDEGDDSDEYESYEDDTESDLFSDDDDEDSTF